MLPLHHPDKTCNK